MGGDDVIMELQHLRSRQSGHSDTYNKAITEIKLLRWKLQTLSDERSSITLYERKYPTDL
mgnify:CR=1 FL=1|jgi:hypothetical protein